MFHLLNSVSRGLFDALRPFIPTSTSSFPSAATVLHPLTLVKCISLTRVFSLETATTTNENKHFQLLFEEDCISADAWCLPGVHTIFFKLPFNIPLSWVKVSSRGIFSRLLFISLIAVLINIVIITKGRVVVAK